MWNIGALGGSHSDMKFLGNRVMIIILTYFRKERETSSEEVSNGELDKKVIHP